MSGVPSRAEVGESPCLLCGKEMREHSSPAEIGEHLTTWLADPDRTAVELLGVTMGMLNGIKIGLEMAPASVLRVHIDREIRHVHEAITRIVRMREQDAKQT